MRAQTVGLGRVDAQKVLDMGDHAGLDLVEQGGFGRIKRVIQIEDPGGDM